MFNTKMKKRMGIVKDNLLTKGFSGKIGDEVVFRQVGGRTVFSKRPRKRTVFKPDEIARQERFQEAVVWAKTVLLDPVVRADYEQRGALAGFKSAFTTALTDYLKEPEIAKVFINNYQGLVGDVIYINTKDNYKITSVEVSITDSNGVLLETGLAEAAEDQWRYVVTQANPVVAGSTITVRAKDRPGKQVQYDEVLA